MDVEPVLRRGDVSASGAYIEVEDPIGQPGSLQKITIAPDDNIESVELLARVARVVSIQDLWRDGPAVAGVALEFLPDTAVKREGLIRVVRHIMMSRSHVAESVVIESGFEAQVGSGLEDALVVRTLELETTWAMSAGDVVQCQVTFGEQSETLTGTVAGPIGGLASLEARQRFSIEFDSGADEGDAHDRALANALGSLLEEVVFPDPSSAPARVDGRMHGQLDRVRLGDVLAVLENEKLSGVVAVTRNDSTATLYLSHGSIVDVDMDAGPEDPRDAIILVCSFVEGEFEFTMALVDRVDRVQASVAELLATPA